MSETYCVKVGGKAAADEHSVADFLSELSALKIDKDIVLIHGGGAEISTVSKRFDYEPVFKNGKRMTTPEEMPIVDMVLAGKMNKYLVRGLYKEGVEAVGLSGSDGPLFCGEAIEPDTHTGTITSVHVFLLEVLLKGGWMPVISPTSMDARGTALNINADEVAFALAAALSAKSLIFVSDIPGILKDNQVVECLSADAALQEIQSGIITNGMIPKVECSVQALRMGVSQIVIGGYGSYGDLRLLFEGKSGTRIEL